MHSAALATADSLLANWLPQAPAASRLALESAARLYTVQALSTTLIYLAMAIICACVSKYLLAEYKRIHATDKYSDDSTPFLVIGVVVTVISITFTGICLFSIPETMAFLFAGKAATALRLMGKF